MYCDDNLLDRIYEECPAICKNCDFWHRDDLPGSKFSCAFGLSNDEQGHCNAWDISFIAFDQTLTRLENKERK